MILNEADCFQLLNRFSRIRLAQVRIKKEEEAAFNLFRLIKPRRSTLCLELD